MKKTFLLLCLLSAMYVFGQPSIHIEQQKMVVTNHGVRTLLAPNGDDASYFWASISPDGKHIVYVTAHLGTFVCDIDGNNVQSMGRMNAPKWLDNHHVAGMQEFYTGHDDIDYIRYICRDINGRNTRDLTENERNTFIAKEESRLKAEQIRQMRRLASKQHTPQQAGLSGVKIYVNPGHGGHDSNDRSCWTIPVPETWSNPNGYWESNSNLVKGLALKEMLEKAGATVIMSRTTNKSGIRDISYYPNATAEQLAELTNGDDRDLSAIAEEANANNVDHFISIHSNALNSQTNYLLMLYHGKTGEPTVPSSDLMAASSGNIQINNPLTVWTSPKPLLRGDLTFYNDDMGLGVLRPLTVPGFLSEGSFHDYAPETHRLCNEDYCRLEALRMYQHFHKWFNRTLPQTATISGWVKSSNELVDILNQPKFVYVKNSDDQWLPLNGAKVELWKDGNKIAEKTTDNWYNGVFAFYDLTPGTYEVKVTKNKYESVVETVTVAAEEIAGLKIRMKNIRMHVEDYPNPDNDAIALPTYEFDAVGAKVATPTAITRALYRENKYYILANGNIKEYNIDFTESRTLPLPTGVVISDIGFTADNFLVGKAKDQGAFYTWDEKKENVSLLFETTGIAGNSFAVSGARWESKYTLANGNTLYSIIYNEDTQSTIVNSQNSTNDWTNKQLTLTPLGTVSATEGASYFNYAKQTYMAKAIEENGKIGFKLYNITSGANSEASALYPAEGLGTNAPYQTTMAWVDGYSIHVVVIAEGLGMQHFQTKVSPVANIYASEVDYDGKNFVFRLNEDATNVSITIEKDNEIVDTHVIGALKKGLNKIVNPFGKKAFDHYSITASARAIAFPVKISDDAPKFQFYAARGVAVDKTPASPYFGRVYVTNSVGGLCTEGSAPSFRNSSMGVFVLSSDFEDITNQDSIGWLGNIEWGENNSATNYQFALSRPSVAENGDVFVASSAFASGGVYIMLAADPAHDFIPVFEGRRSKSNGQLKAGTKVITNPVMHSYVTGMGDEEILYTYDRNNSLGTIYGNINQYNIGELDSLPWSTVPSGVFFDDMATGSHVQNGNGQIAYDQHGGFFISQYRYNSSAAIPGLLHVNAKGEVDFNIANNGVDAVQQGGMGVSADGSLVALGTELGTVKVWSVTYDAAGKPTLEEKYEINWGDGAGVTMGVDFDAAGNLYIVSNSNERLMVYALPNTNNTYTTRVPLIRETTDRNTGKKEDEGEETGTRNAALNAYTSNMSSSSMNTSNRVMITYTLNAPASGLEMQLLNDNKEIVQSISLNYAELRTKGSHRTEVDLTGIAPGVYHWAIQAKSLPLPDGSPLQVVSNLPQKLNYSKGIAIDNDYNSPYFGQVYVGDASGTTVVEEKGIYVYDATLEEARSVGAKPWSAAISAPMRLTVGEDHMVYICEWSDAYPNNTYILNPADLNTLTPVFGGTPATDGIYKTADGKHIHGSISHVWVEGTGADRVMYTFDEDIEMDGLKNPMGLFRYDIGELNTPWESAPSALIFDNADKFEQNGNSTIIPDAYGWWISQDRATDSYEIPALIHINAEGKVDFNSNAVLGGRTRGGLAFNQDMTIMATPSDNSIRIWKVTYDDAGVPNIALDYPVTTTFGGQNNASCFSLAFDVAGNLYATGKGSMCVWALPTDNICTVQAPDSDQITIVPSGLVDITAPNQTNKMGVYSVTGQYLGMDIEQLPQGIYIVNGQKVIK